MLFNQQIVNLWMLPICRSSKIWENIGLNLKKKKKEKEKATDFIKVLSYGRGRK